MIMVCTCDVLKVCVGPNNWLFWVRRYFRVSSGHGISCVSCASIVLNTSGTAAGKKCVLIEIVKPLTVCWFCNITWNAALHKVTNIHHLTRRFKQCSLAKCIPSRKNTANYLWVSRCKWNEKMAFVRDSSVPVRGMDLFQSSMCWQAATVWHSWWLWRWIRRELRSRTLSRFHSCWLFQFDLLLTLQEWIFFRLLMLNGACRCLRLPVGMKMEKSARQCHLIKRHESGASAAALQTPHLRMGGGVVVVSCRVSGLHLLVYVTVWTHYKC